MFKKITFPYKLLKFFIDKTKVKIKAKVLYINKVPKVAKDRELLFIHIPKAAGSTVSLGLYGMQIGHKKAKDYFIYDQCSYEKIKSFTFVRHPITRFESAYYFLIQGGMSSNNRNERDKYLRKYKDINEFIDNIDESFIRSGKIIHFLPQVDFIFLNDVCLVDKIFKLEDASSIDFKSELNFNFPKKSKNKTKPVEKIPLTQRSLDKLNQLYEVDLLKFGYNLDE